MRRRAHARQDAQTRQAALPAATVQWVVDLGALCAAGGSQPLDRSDAGEGGGREFAIGATHPRGPSTRPPSHPNVQAVERSQVRRELKDIVGLFVDPPAHAVVLSVDEKSQIRALDRTQPGLPMKPGRAGTMTHDYKRHGHQMGARIAYDLWTLSAANNAVARVKLGVWSIGSSWVQPGAKTLRRGRGGGRLRRLQKAPLDWSYSPCITNQA